MLGNERAELRLKDRLKVYKEHEGTWRVSRQHAETTQEKRLPQRGQTKS